MGRYRPFIPLAILIVSLTILFYPIIFCGQTLFIRDLTFIFHPWKTACAEAIQKGEFPLWDPYVYCGMPLFANWQSAVLYPFSLVFCFFSFPSALKAYHFVHLQLGGTFAFLFARKLGLSRWASAVLMTVFALSGYSISRLEFLSHIGTDIWLFALLLFIGNPWLLALSFALAVLSGHQVVALLALTVLLFSLTVITTERGTAVRNSIIALFAGSLLSACQVLPTIELASLSARAREGIAPATAFLYSLSPGKLASVIWPALGAAAENAVSGERYFWLFSFYVGLVTVLSAAFGLVWGKDRRLILFAALLLVLGIILSLGDTTPVYPWLYRHFYPLRLMRYPPQFMLLTVAGLALLAASGAERLRLSPLIAVAVAAELLILSHGFQATAPNAYFGTIPRSVGFLRGLPDNGRFILSPGTEKDRSMRGDTVVDGWQNARSFLYGLTSVPYHIPNAYGSGEPLTPAAVEDAVSAAYSRRTPGEAIPLYRELAVSDLLCKHPLPESKDYKLVHPSLPLIYRIDNGSTLVAASHGSPKVSAYTRTAGRVSFTCSSDRDTALLFRESWFPGWQAFSNGKPVPVSAAGAFRSFPVRRGTSSIIQVYRPLSFRTGVLTSLTALLFMALFAIIKLRHE